MRVKKAFSLAEIMVGFVVMAVLATLSIPSLINNAAEKTYTKGLVKAYKTVSKVVDDYLNTEDNYIESTQESAVLFTKFFIENANIKELYSDSNPTKNSNTYSALKFKGNVLAGAKDPASISPKIQITNKPQFWFVTEDNLSYSVIIPNDAKCNEVLNINTAHTLKKTLTMSCLAVVVDTNGLYNNPNTIEEIDDIAQEKYVPNLTNDRYYIFVGVDGSALGNQKHILAAKIYSTNSNI